MTPEQSFGLLAFDLDPPRFDGPEARGDGAISRMRLAADAEALTVELTLASPLPDDASLVLAFDTYADDLGESVLPDGTTSPRRVEIALTIGPGATAQALTMESYALYDDPPGETLTSVKRSTVSDAGDWREVWWLLAAAHTSADGAHHFDEDRYPIGRLRLRRASEPASSLDAVVVDGNRVTVRMPWLLLSFADPSRRLVVHDDPSTPELDGRVSEGVAVVASYAGDLRSTDRFAFATWDHAPPTTERLKASVPILTEGLATLPRWLDTP